MTLAPVAHGRTRAFYDGISRVYDFIADSSEHAMREIGVSALGLSSGERVLEIGCGTGHGLVALAADVGHTGWVHGVDISSGMLSVARRRIESAGLRNVTLTLGDACLLCFQPRVFDAVFLSFTLEVFDRAIPEVFAEVSRVLRMGGRVGIVAMSATGQTNAMTELYAWLHRRWPQFVDCSPIDVVGVLEAAQFHTSSAHAMTIWGLPVMVAIGTKPSVERREDSTHVRTLDPTERSRRPERSMYIPGV